ncbi:uroporphyrin-III C-methyltransferase/precorrin-2 dehydrogenase/sirohydrochlorin ferrochelatase [Litoreibacter meonggei]|uniref:Uroporphyrin-III C-methyltransferase/precorrin-2 dehydrogenase/sirohydrochlorin ferrochelatase n=1 Tax=Litoreibacter meonggei TaxID=1049199 RepID=A0A497VMX9_9RHOB|nr:siroheme synthase CysG [Litoreibacter meonggei]RLJ41555.1 uroporphyrin-III C-methyltransferase/precorrin-2 dehydrogenase/sirohydrochlorin ferrochelatase [Litoreibacter meonggei]
MKHFPIFMALEGRRVVVSGGGEAALAKLRLLLKTEANLTVIASNPAPEIASWAAKGRLTLIARPMEAGDALCARLFYAANENDAEDARVADLANREGALVNIVDNLEDSQFITPAMVDRDPVVVAIGTEGAAPVLARAIKKDIEERLSPRLGLMARIGKAFRAKAEALPFGVKRREFWAEYYSKDIATSEDAKTTLDALLDKHLSAHGKEGRVDLVGAGPGDPELLTLKARKALDAADVVIYDRLVAPEILELARREAIMLSAGKEGFGPSVTQDAINEMIVSHARNGAHVVRLKSGDPTVFGRLDEEIEACEASGVAWSIVPGITSASAAVAALGQSFTKRGRNSGVRFITGHDTKGFADHDWKTLARAGEVAAIYMGKKSARFIQGRLLMHGADALTQVTVIENASRPDQRILATTLGELEPTLTQANLTGPALVFLGLAPRAALNAAQQHELEAAI